MSKGYVGLLFFSLDMHPITTHPLKFDLAMCPSVWRHISSIIQNNLMKSVFYGKTLTE